MKMERRVLIIDDEENIRKYLGYALKKDGYDVAAAQFGKEGLRLITQQHFDVVILDLNLPDITGLEVLEAINEIDVDTVVILITAYGDIESAVRAIKLGAFDYLTKPFEVDDIKHVIKKALMVLGLEGRIQALERQVDRSFYGELITRSTKMADILSFIDHVAVTQATVMIYGETGTGKELIASLIHKRSKRVSKPFITIDCTSIPENLLESELFGHEKGAFTGAIKLKRGLFELASGGTVFLDEIGELPIMLQSKLLRVLDSRTFRRVGGEVYLETDVRVVAATNRNLKEMVKDGRFRSDLLYRLDVLPIYLPPLRERREDIFPLIEYFIQFYNKKIGKNLTSISNDAINLMVGYNWPGNIRELKNVVEHSVITCKSAIIRKEDLILRENKIAVNQPQNIGLEDNGFDPDYRSAKKRVIEHFEINYFNNLLNKNDWNISKCAREIGMHRSSFQRLLRKYGLQNRKTVN